MFPGSETFNNNVELNRLKLENERLKQELALLQLKKENEELKAKINNIKTYGIDHIPNLPTDLPINLNGSITY